MADNFSRAADQIVNQMKGDLNKALSSYMDTIRHTLQETGESKVGALLKDKAYYSQHSGFNEKKAAKNKSIAKTSVTEHRDREIEALNESGLTGQEYQNKLNEINALYNDVVSVIDNLPTTTVKNTDAAKRESQWTKLQAIADKKKAKLLQELENKQTLLEKSAKERIKFYRQLENQYNFSPKPDHEITRELTSIQKTYDYIDNREIAELEKLTQAVKKASSGKSSMSFSLDEIMELSKRITSSKKRSRINHMYYDLETNIPKIGSNEKNMPVQLGLYKKGSVEGTYYLDYGKKEETLKHLLNAANSKQDGKLGEAAQQLRSALGLDEKAQLEFSARSKRGSQLLGSIQKQMMTPKKFFEMVKSGTGGKSRLAGYNNHEADDNWIWNWINAYQGKEQLSSAEMSELKTLLDNSLDVREEELAQRSGVEGNQAKYLKGGLQNMALLLHGVVDKMAHNSGSDVKTTEELHQLLETTDTIKQLSEFINQKAQERGIARLTSSGRYTSDYQKLAQEAVQSLANLKFNPSAFGGQQISASVKQVNSKLAATAQQRVQDVMNALGDAKDKSKATRGQKAMTFQHLKERNEKLGNYRYANVMPDQRGEGSIFEKDSASYYLEAIINNAKEQGLGVLLGVSSDKSTIKVGLYDEAGFKGKNKPDFGNEKVAQIEFGLVDTNGTINMGGQAKANIMFPTTDWYKDEKGNTRGRPVVLSANELQFRNVANLLRKQIDDQKNEVKNNFVEKIRSGNISSANNSLRFARDRVISESPTTASTTAFLETMGDIDAKKNPEQMAAVLGMTSLKEFAQNFYRFYQEAINEIYADVAKAQDKKTSYVVDPYNLTNKDYDIISSAYGIISQGQDVIDSQSERIQDGVLKSILTDERFRYFRDTIRALNQGGFVPSYESLKEESFGSGFFTTSGAHSIMPFFQFGDNSNRALNQIFNYSKRANAPTIGKQNIWSSKVGGNIGVDYNKRELTQYYGATTTDEEILNAFKELGITLNNVVTSVHEGGIVIPQRMATELAALREESAVADIKDISKSFLNNFGLSLDDLSLLQNGETYLMNETVQDSHIKDFSSQFSVNAGDVVLGITKVDEGFKLLVQRLEHIGEGTKLLAGGGIRGTARVLSDDTFDALTSKLGVSGAQFLTEANDISSKNLMPYLQGRIGYIVYAALGDGKTWDEIAEAVKLMPTWGKYLQVIGDKLVARETFLDDEGYKYYDDNGRVKSLFTVHGKQELRSVYEKAFNESSIDSDISKFGKALLGDQKYQDTRKLTAQFLNKAHEFPYFDPAGSGSAKVLEKVGRVKFGFRERDAFKRTAENYRANIENQGNKAGLDRYINSEVVAQATYGPRGLQAQQYIQDLQRSLDTDTGAAKTILNNAKAIELVAYDETKALKDNQINIRTALEKFDWNEDDGLGISMDQYSQSLSQMIREKQKELGEGYENVILNLADSGLKVNRENEAKLLADIAPVIKEVNGQKRVMPSLTDTALNRVVKAVKGDDVEALNKSLEELNSAYSKAATDKHSDLFKLANESLVPNSSYVKVVGQNIARASAMLAGNGGAENTVAISENHLRGLLQSAEGSSNADIAKNLRDLSFLLRSQGKAPINIKGIEDYADMEKMTRQAQEGSISLMKLEEELINTIIAQVKTGNLDLVAQMHRYPSTSGTDIRHSHLTIDDSLTDGTAAISWGEALTTNADFDGDKKWVRAILGLNAETLEQYKEAYGAAHSFAEIEDKIAADMAEWDRNNSQPKDDAMDKLINDMMDRSPNRFAALMSKSNKKYVGQFSNVSTNMRTAMMELGLDEYSQAGNPMAAYAALVRAFFESLEQDAISAKKVFQRLSSEKGEQVAFDELTGLYNQVMSGDFNGAIDTAESLGILKDELNMRQFKLASTTLKYAHPELYGQLDLDHGTSSTILKAAFEQVTKAIGDKFNGNPDMVKNIMWNNKTYQDAKKNAARKGKTTKKSIPVVQPSGKDKVKVTLPNGVKINLDKTAVGQYIAGRAKPTATYEVDHTRDIELFGEAVAGKGAKNRTLFGAAGQQETITQLIHSGDKFDENSYFGANVAGEKSAIAGTYGHALIEAMGGERVTYLAGVAGNKVQEATEKFKAAYGNDATPEIISDIQQRAEALIQLADKLNLFNDNTKQETTLGGYIVGSEKGISGAADLFTFDEHGATVADWKFSKDDSQKTRLSRFFQGSAYMRMEEAETMAKISELQEKQDKGTITDKETAELQQKAQELEAIQKNAQVRIIRSFEEKGKIIQQVITGQALSMDFVIESLKKLQNGGSLDMEQIYNQAGINVQYYDRDNNVIPDYEVKNDAQVRKNANQQTTAAISNMKQQSKVRQDIARAQKTSEGLTGIELENQRRITAALQSQYAVLQSQAPIIDEQAKTVNGIYVGEENILKIKKEAQVVNAREATEMQKIAAIQNQQKGFLQKLLGGFKQQITYLIDMSLAYQAVGKLRQVITTLIQETQQLDQAMVNIQIATGNTRAETRELMLEYNQLAYTLGRTTQEVANASNDWLRAGYEGKEAAELTKASMMLSTLGMIDSAQATTYLISTLKGWKMQANEVIGVVDALSAVDMSAAISAGS